MTNTTTTPTLIINLDDILDHAGQHVEDYDGGDEITPPCYSVGFASEIMTFRLADDLMEEVSCGWSDSREIAGDYDGGVEYLAVTAEMTDLRIVTDEDGIHHLHADILYSEGLA